MATGTPGSMLQRLLASLALAPLLPLALLTLTPARAQFVIKDPSESRPAGLVIIENRLTLEGPRVVGVYAVTTDEKDPSLRRIKVWYELPNNVNVRNETIRCAPSGPMRVTPNGTNLMVRELNPGGLISPVNREDHLVWWTSCFPEQGGGKEPSTLRALALKLGFNGNLQEKEYDVPGAR